jgi:hypothetical protein
LLTGAIEEDVPLALAESPKALRAAKAFHLSLGKLADRCGNALDEVLLLIAEAKSTA